MIKLFTLKDLSAFSADTVFKICLKLESYGFSEENIVEFDNYNALYKNVLDAMENGENIIVAGDNSDYCDIKKELISRLILQEHSCSKISECIALNAGDDIAEIDMSAHCLVPFNSVNHLSIDGLYSGFTTKVLNGQLTVFPLDFSRIDKIIESLISDIFEKNLLEEPENEDSQENQSTVAYDFTPSVSKMIYSLSQLDKTLSLATSEAVMWIYGLYEQISGIAETVNFVEVVDEEVEGYEDQEPESESSIVVRHSREAMYNMNSDFGGSISDVYALEKEDGTTEYFAFVAVCDRVSARVKKIKTANVEDLGILLSHCVVMLSETICQKADAISLSLSKVYDVTEEDEDDELEPGDIDVRDIPKNKLNLMIAGLVCAILVPIIITFIFASEDATIPTLATTSTTFNYDYITSTTAASTTLFPGITEGTTDTTFADDALLPSEDAATEVSAATTTTSVASESGVFTFTVFGYGHGVGLSQEGANYYASDGWNYAEILAMYYYGATLVSGDVYPDTITYAGSTYETREYLASALASEMSSTFSSEAQKAQVVAIYTFAKYYDYNVSSSGHAFGKTATEAQYAIVDEVMSGGLYIAYNGSTALTPFHAISAGTTTSYYNTWGSYNVTYLAGGRPSYGDTLVDDFQTTYSVTTDDFKTMVIESLGIELTGDPSTWITILTHDACVTDDIGYVATMSVGGQIITGNEFRSSVLDGNIRSHCFALTYTPDA